MSATDWAHIVDTNWLLLTWLAAGSVVLGGALAYCTRPWWYPRLIARRVLRRRQLP